MRKNFLIYLAITLLIVGSPMCHASLGRFMSRRQSSEAEQESITPKSQTEPAQQQPPSTTTVSANGGNNNSPTEGRLYPDLPHTGPNFLPPFNAHPRAGAMQPFVPVGVLNRLNMDQQQPGSPGLQMLPPPRPMSLAERIQSHSFTGGLGKRLLAMIGVDTSQNQTQFADNGGRLMPTSRPDLPHLRALQNSTVLQELNKRVNVIMGRLSKMYNSTVQEQLNLLYDLFEKEAKNSTNPWQQRVAQQVPMFFKQMAGRVNDAQEQLNRVWHDVVQVAHGNKSGGANGQRSSFFNTIDQFVRPLGNGSFLGSIENDGADFLNDVSRSLGMQHDQPGSILPGGLQQQPQAHLGARLKEFWHVQVQPQIGMVRNQMAQVWQDLTNSGALTLDTIRRSHMRHNNNDNSSENDLVDRILKEADTEADEFSLISPRSNLLSSDGASNQTQAPANGMPRLIPYMQDRLVAMQRDLNRLWQGLSSSLQNAVSNVRNTLNPPPLALGSGAMNQKPQEADNEINGKVQNLSKLQSEADVVYDTVQQRQRDAQLHQTIADRFRGFVNNVNLNGLHQLNEQIGNQVNRFGAVMGNLWNVIPETWDNRMAQRQNQENQARLMAQLNAKLAATSTAAPTAERTQ